MPKSGGAKTRRISCERVKARALPSNQPPDMAKVVEIFQRYDVNFLAKPA
jgi:hypothetical protein